MMPDGRSLSRTIDYEFDDPQLLTEALTHRSRGSRNNERLEFLGDAILSYVITDALYRRFPEASEGELSRYRASLVRGETLAELARAMNLGEFLLLGPGELKSGGFNRASILANAVEAVIGAVYLDGGLEAASRFVMSQYAERLQKVNDMAELKDPKTRLQEFLQGRSRPLPNYDVSDVSGEAHKQVFVVSCTVADLDKPVQGRGSSRRRAEQDAAARALDLLGADRKAGRR